MDKVREAQLVNPFYLDMMRTNALRYGSARAPAIIGFGREVTTSEVTELLRDCWRQRVMGAWYALLHDDEQVTDAVLEALLSSHGSLDSPPLATVAVVLASYDAIPVLETYIDNDMSCNWGACGFSAGRRLSISVRRASGTPPRTRTEYVSARCSRSPRR